MENHEYVFVILFGDVNSENYTRAIGNTSFREKKFAEFELLANGYAQERVSGIEDSYVLLQDLDYPLEINRARIVKLRLK